MPKYHITVTVDTSFTFDVEATDEDAAENTVEGLTIQELLWKDGNYNVVYREIQDIKEIK